MEKSKYINLNLRKKHSECQGFTLIETIIAIFILTIGVLGVYLVFAGFYNQSKNYSNYLTASYLSQEGMEIIRNMRDYNWTQGNSSYWLDQIDNGNCANGCDFEVDFKTGTSIESIIFPYQTRVLNIDNDGVYSYSNSGEYLPTIFKRKITITGPLRVQGSPDYSENPDLMIVTSKVIWDYNGNEYNVQMEEFLYNWY